MCGVAATFGAVGPDDVELVRSINTRQCHRGPDAAEIWQRPGVILGHTRLAIVDVSSAGSQPFLSAGGDVAVVYNGEIYNHLELRRRYSLRVASGCDGAILPELWCRFGPAMFEQLRGMFAAVIHDARDGSLILARDPFGIKPLYWTRCPGGSVRVASEPRVLAHLTGATRLSEQALRHYLAFGSLARDMSPFTGIECVPANGWIRFPAVAGGRPSSQTGPQAIRSLTQDEAQPLPDALVDSVRGHLVSDVPVALLLSSGVDSAALAWGVREAGARLTCVTVGMGGGRREDQLAAAIARRFGHEHMVVAQPPDLAVLDAFFAAMQRPTVDGLNSYVINRAVSQLGIRVALSGLGGDEVLAGYAHFRQLRTLGALRMADRLGLGRALALAPAQRGVARLLGQKAAALVSRTGPRDARSYAALRRRVLLDREVADLAPGLPPPEPELPIGGTTARELSEAELVGYLGGTLLPDADAFSMCWSVELRVPYVDPRFASTALSFDPQRGVGKKRFAALLGDPALIAAASRPKQGFTLPMEEWMRVGPLRGYVNQLRGSAALLRQLLSPRAVDATVEAWHAGRLPWPRMWQLAALEAWLRSVESANGNL